MSTFAQATERSSAIGAVVAKSPPRQSNRRFVRECRVGAIPLCKKKPNDFKKKERIDMKNNICMWRMGFGEVGNHLSI